MNATAAPIIQAHNLRFAYAKSAPILHIKDFKVNQGERVFIHGPSGSGKTTLLGLLSGVLHATGGELQILGIQINQLSASKRDAFRGEHIGYIFQMFNLIPYLNVLENITLPCRLHKKRRERALKIDPESSTLEDLAQHQASALGIAELLNKSVLELSVGQRQRVAAARAFMGHPELIIADEPTSALDANRRQDFLNLLFENASKNNATILFVSHDPFLKDSFDRVVELNDINQEAN